jgi:D-galactarolactone cycloisomerase
VRGDGLLEIDANPNPLRSRLIDPVLRIKDGMVTPPATPGLGIEPDIEALSDFVVLKLEHKT